MWTVKFKAQPSNVCLASIVQMFGRSSHFPSTVERCFVLWTVLNDLNTAHSAVVRSWRELPNNRLIVLKNEFVNWSQMTSKWGKGQGSFFNCIVKFLAEVYLISSCYVSMTWKRQKKLWLTRKHREMTCKLKRWLGQQSYVLFWLLGEKYEQGHSQTVSSLLWSPW